MDRLQKVARRGAGGRKGKSPSTDSLDVSTGLILQSPGSSIAGRRTLLANIVAEGVMRREKER